ncbi:dTDP-4-dehydrorhamnose reductase [Micromonospora terminaliae]|uniref:dTDP-4-dehydrorhamnose reductase n=1 Tax=Micromonospora terminaliae TaxID=1914461 RepID=A0AAJ2ZIG6_9ACTN|nr:dTDP-4-dehydrorhamnose reductase [Micromonospora terminaliae]NES30508.1 dTDP-4-dehydrorhamnose reductase [Micromonospora terminaliae]QGL46546.1 dTDP-4-dehydrorhamnose reductase [Micromonospora terminaliae]
MSRLLVTGAAGMLGREVVAVLRSRADLSVTATTRAELDITDPDAVHATVAGHDLVINTAAWTDVDGAETREEVATAVNGDAVAHLARACAATGARMIHISTDYVFPGDATEPYPEDAATFPVNAYGRSKLAGELAVAKLLPHTGYLVRTAWLYGEHGPNFVATMLRLAEEREWLDVVNDQRGQPTWSYRLAERLVALADAALAGRAAPGAYHGTASGEATWYDLARAVFALRGLDPDRIRPTTSDRYRRPASRPAYSVLGHERWAAAKLPPLEDWRSALAQALAAGMNR